MIVGLSRIYVRVRRVKDGWKARVEVDGKSRTLSGIYQSAIAARQAGLEACHRAIAWRLVMLAFVGLGRASGIIRQANITRRLLAIAERLRAIFGWRLMIDCYTIKLYRARSNRTQFINYSGA